MNIEKLIGKSVVCGSLLRLFTCGRFIFWPLAYFSCDGQSVLFVVQHYSMGKSDAATCGDISDVLELLAKRSTLVEE